MSGRKQRGRAKVRPRDPHELTKRLLLHLDKISQILNRKHPLRKLDPFAYPPDSELTTYIGMARATYRQIVQKQATQQRGRP